jgi:hypothetical protein
MKVMIDLFSGLGGASTAFCEDPTWKVIRIDNNPDIAEAVPGTWTEDLNNIGHVLDRIKTELYDYDVKKMVVWASPPCTEFSTKNPDRNPDEWNLKLLRATIIYIRHLANEYNVVSHFIENVRGAIHPFNELLGPYRQRIGPFFLWGRFVPVACIDADTHRHRKPFNSTNSRTHLRSNIHAKIPYALSQSVLESVEKQWTLARWVE